MNIGMMSVVSVHPLWSGAPLIHSAAHMPTMPSADQHAAVHLAAELADERHEQDLDGAALRKIRPMSSAS